MVIYLSKELMRILAVIPARVWSKGIPNKNHAIINDLSLVAVTIKCFK